MLARAFHPVIELDDFGIGAAVALAADVIAGGMTARRPDAVGLGERGHGGQIVLDHGEGRGIGVTGDVVAGEDDDCWAQSDHVGSEGMSISEGLAADAAIDVGLPGRICQRGGPRMVMESPEHDSLFTAGGVTLALSAGSG